MPAKNSHLISEEEREKLIKSHPDPELLLRFYERSAQFNESMMASIWARVGCVLVINSALIGGFAWVVGQYSQNTYTRIMFIASAFHACAFLAWLVSSTQLRLTLKSKTIPSPYHESYWGPQIMECIDSAQMDSPKHREIVRGYTIRFWCEAWALVNGDLHALNTVRAVAVSYAIQWSFFSVILWALGTAIVLWVNYSN